MEYEDHLEEARKVFNHIGILFDMDICRCVGFADDGEDYYWIVIRYNKATKSTDTVYASKVGGFVSLKDLNYPNYERMDNLMDENKELPRARAFRVEIIHSNKFL